MVASLKELSNAQLCQVFNALTGQKVKRFTSVADGVSRIAKVLNATGTNLRDALELAGIEAEHEDQEEIPAVCMPVEALPDPNELAVPPSADDEPERFKDKHGFVHRKREPRRNKRGRSNGKLEIVLGLLRRPSGATVPEIMEATGWLPHTTRAYLSKGGAPAKAGHKIRRAKRGPSDQSISVYSVAE